MLLLLFLAPYCFVHLCFSVTVSPFLLHACVSHCSTVSCFYEAFTERTLLSATMVNFVFDSFVTDFSSGEAFYYFFFLFYSWPHNFSAVAQSQGTKNKEERKTLKKNQHPHLKTDRRYQGHAVLPCFCSAYGKFHKSASSYWVLFSRGLLLAHKPYSNSSVHDLLKAWLTEGAAVDSCWALVGITDTPGIQCIFVGKAQSSFSCL